MPTKDKSAGITIGKQSNKKPKLVDRAQDPGYSSSDSIEEVDLVKVAEQVEQACDPI